MTREHKQQIWYIQLLMKMLPSSQFKLQPGDASLIMSPGDLSEIVVLVHHKDGKSWLSIGT